MHRVEICGVNTNEIPKLSEKESRELLIKIHNGDQVAREKFVYANMRLVLSIVQRFNRYNNQDSDDLFQVGCLGMIKALNNFDISLNVRFSTYAVPMIIGEIKRFLRDSNSIKVSRSTRDIAYKALKTREIMEYSGKQASLMEVADEIDVPISEVACALDAISETISLYEPVFNDGEDTLSLFEQISDKKNTDTGWIENFAIAEAIKLLPDKEKNILNMRYYQGKTQKEIAEIVGISQAQVSRLEKMAISNMKKHISV